MNKEFVTYEQALALKELGFDEPCFGYYYTLNGKNWNFADKVEYCKLNDEIDIGGKFTISAPLYQQAFRWFREKHQIEAIVSCVYSKTLDISYEERRYHCYIVRDGITTKGIKFKNYEEAERACLDKLIEIVKNK